MMRNVYKNKQLNAQNIALNRIDKLFKLAESEFKEHPELSHRYVKLARNLSTRYKLRFTNSQKRASCKSCNHYLKNGVNCTVRIVSNRIVITCLDCKNVRRIGFKKK